MRPIASTLRVAALVVTPPVYKASGGVSAAIQLSQRIARLVPLELVVMSDRDEIVMQDGMKVTWRKATNRLGPMARFLPNIVRVLMWRGGFYDWLDRNRPDIVHIHNPHPPAALEEAATACRALNIPYVVTTHGIVEFADYAAGFGSPAWMRPFISRFVRAPLVRTLRAAACVFSLSPNELPITRAMGISDDRVRVITNGVDPYYRERLDIPDRERLVQRFELPEHRCRFLFVGNHTRNKGIDLLLKAVQQVDDAVAIVCGGIRSEREHASMLKEAGIESGDPRVLFSGFATLEELRALYQSADVFVFPSRADTLPLVILEAMASGLPVIASDIGGIPYQVTADTGIVVPPNNVDMLVEAMRLLAGDPIARTRLGKAGRARADELFDWENSAKLGVNSYRKILEARG